LFGEAFGGSNKFAQRSKHMDKRFVGLGLAVVVAVMGGLTPARADDFVVDAMHSSVTFKISHLGLAWVYGRFDEFSGKFTVDAANPAKSSFQMTVKTESVDTNNAKRDGHLRSPDFFNAKQFPTMTFQSTKVEPIKNGYKVTGTLTLHGVTKEVKFDMVGGRVAEFPPGVQRTGFSTEFTIDRTHFGVGGPNFATSLGLPVYIAISFEGTRRK
jgi:polyisoprenoid-binding protein YceI